MFGFCDRSSKNFHAHRPTGSGTLKLFLEVPWIKDLRVCVCCGSAFQKISPDLTLTAVRYHSGLSGSGFRHFEHKFLLGCWIEELFVEAPE